MREQAELIRINQTYQASRAASARAARQTPSPPLQHSKSASLVNLHTENPLTDSLMDTTGQSDDVRRHVAALKELIQIRTSYLSGGGHDAAVLGQIQSLETEARLKITQVRMDAQPIMSFDLPHYLL